MRGQSGLKAELKAAKDSATEQAFLLRQISVAADTHRGTPKAPRRCDSEPRTCDTPRCQKSAMELSQLHLNPVNESLNTLMEILQKFSLYNNI